MGSDQLSLRSKALEIQAEAQANTKILEGAGLERYISETYISRVFYELIQNADDSKSTRFIAKNRRRSIFLNDSNIFTSADLEAICRSAFRQSNVELILDIEVLALSQHLVSQIRYRFIVAS